MDFYGREKEIELLNRWTNRLPKGHLTAIYGRRRVGKTRLVREAFRASPCCQFLTFEGLEDEPKSRQIYHFLSQLADYTNRKEYRSIVTNDWTEALGYLADYVENHASREKPIILFFDEFQWLAGERSELVSRFKFIWDNRLADLPVHVILCGSVSSFIVKKVIQSKALYGRIHLEIHLKPLSVPEIRPFLAKRSLHEVIDLYLSIGGIPQYLEMIDPRKSTQLNLQELCFSPHGYLVNEFDRIFVSHFGRNTHFNKILATLAKTPNISRETIAKRCKIETGGSLSRYLQELELAGFIERYVPVGKSLQSRSNRYRLADPYLLFYFRFIFPAKKEIQSGNNLSFARLMPEKVLAPWRGLAFERLCITHQHLIAKKLGFSAVAYDAGAWFKRADDDPGAQIDLLFDRADRVVSVCELKYSKDKIGKSVIAEVQQKVDIYPNPGNKLTIEPILISASEVTKDVESEGYFTRILYLDDIFG